MCGGYPVQYSARIAGRKAVEFTDGLTKNQRKTYIGAMQQYMTTLNQTCRYPTIAEHSFDLPPAFFDIRPAPEATIPFAGSVFLKKGVSFSQALDSLAGGRHIIDCAVAATLTFLQGIRAVVSNDPVFELIMQKMTEKSADIEITNYHHNSIVSILVGKKSTNAPTIGGSCYVQQRSRLEEFTCHDGNSETLEMLTKGTCPYDAKHGLLNMKRINTIVIGIDAAGPAVIFFDPEINKQQPLRKVALSLIDALDQDMSQQEYEQIYPLELKDYQQQGAKGGISPEFRATLNLRARGSIKYTNKEESAKNIVRDAKFYGPNFTEIFKCREQVDPARIAAAQVAAEKATAKATAKADQALKSFGLDPKNLKTKDQERS